MNAIYLHGFASGPASRKARYLSEKLAVHGVALATPDLAPNFEHLTISSQLALLQEASDELGSQRAPLVLIGSSMGGYLAALYASQHPEVARLLLLAPAFDFYHLWVRQLGPKKLEQWRENGVIPVFHYGLGREASLGYQLIEDARVYPPFPEFTQPCLILHGRKDSVVPFEQSAQFAAKSANVVLVSLNTDHEMTDVLEEIWQAASTFLLGCPACFDRADG